MCSWAWACISLHLKNCSASAGLIWVRATQLLRICRKETLLKKHSRTISHAKPLEEKPPRCWCGRICVQTLLPLFTRLNLFCFTRQRRLLLYCQRTCHATRNERAGLIRLASLASPSAANRSEWPNIRHRWLISHFLWLHTLYIQLNLFPKHPSESAVVQSI